MAETKAHGRVVLLLRGINVGGRHSLPMAALRSLLTDQLRCADVQTYIQSGNVVCTAPAAGLKTAEVSQGIEQRLGFTVPVALRKADEWNAVVAANPFLSPDTDAEFLHLVLLAEPLSAERWTMLQKTRSGDEQLTAMRRELYLSLPHGVGRSKLALACVSPKMPPDATMRNWRTVLQLQSML
jgi:uncharacterized protein (DUF1697 family)